MPIDPFPPWNRAPPKHALCVACSSAFFFGITASRTGSASRRPDVGSVVFDWERKFPLRRGPSSTYWSIDLLYGLSCSLRYP